MRANLSARLARLESDARRTGVRYTVSSRVLPDDEWQADHDGGLASAEDTDHDPVITESEWIAAHCSLPESHRQ